jgi:hypothetical protein
MSDNKRCPDVIDFFWEWQGRHKKSSPMAELALDKCEEAFLRRDWKGFSYWHPIYCRSRTEFPRRPFRKSPLG